MTENKSVDRRIVRTRRAIRDALVTLINEKGFDAVTVRDITALANINRGTFYLHYQDKFDLLEQTEMEILQDIQDIFLQADARQAEDSNMVTQLHRLVIGLLEYVKANAESMQAFLGLQGSYSLITRLRGMMEQNLNIGGLAGLKAERFSVPREYLLSYIIHAHLGVLQAWFMTGCKETPEEMARILFRLSFDGPMRAAGLDITKA